MTNLLLVKSKSCCLGKPSKFLLLRVTDCESLLVKPKSVHSFSTCWADKNGLLQGIETVCLNKSE